MSALAVQPPPATIARQRFDELERAMMRCPQGEAIIRHVFTPGLYCREMSAAAGQIITSKIHRTEHPFVLSKGRILVADEEGNSVEICAPFMGITKPGTRRAAIVLEDVVWTTFHPTDLTDVDQIEAAIIEPHAEHLDGLAQPPALAKECAACLG